MFRFSSESATTTIPANKNTPFVRPILTPSTLSQAPITANISQTSASVSPSIAYSKRLPSPLINKYRSNQSTITDTESLASYGSNGTNTNSTIATSIATSPPQPSKLSSEYTHSLASVNSNDDTSTLFDKGLPHRRLPQSPSDHAADDSIYQLVRMDTRMSFESCYVEPPEEKYRIKLSLNDRQIELLRYTWNKMLLEESNSSDNMPGAFTTTPAEKKSPRKKTNTKIESTTIASSLFCRQFYFNLLSKDPELEKLFPSIKHQAVSFAGILTFTISQLENLANLDEFLLKLGKLHARILNIEAPQFQLMGEALIQTFQERFGYKFNKELENLWVKLYLYLANSLLQYGIDPVLKLQRFESNGTVDTSATTVDIINTSSSMLRDDLSSMEPSSLTKSSSNMSLAKPLPTVVQLSLKDMTIPEQKAGIKKKLHTKMKNAKNNNCVIM